MASASKAMRKLGLERVVTIEETDQDLRLGFRV
jgi:hypothetical protein